MLEMLLGGIGSLNNLPHDGTSANEQDMDDLRMGVLDALMEMMEKGAPPERKRNEAKLLRRKRMLNDATLGIARFVFDSSTSDETIKDAAMALEDALAIIEKFTKAHPVPGESVVNN